MLQRLLPTEVGTHLSIVQSPAMAVQPGSSATPKPHHAYNAADSQIRVSSLNDWKRRITGVRAGLGEAHVRGVLTMSEPPPVLVMVYAQQQVEKGSQLCFNLPLFYCVGLENALPLLPSRSTRICQTSSWTPSAPCLQAGSRKLSTSSNPRT